MSSRVLRSRARGAGCGTRTRAGMHRACALHLTTCAQTHAAQNKKQVNEEGTVAAAVTGMVAASAMFNPEPPLEFTADRPFAFSVVHVRSGLRLFEAAVQRPAEYAPAL